MITIRKTRLFKNEGALSGQVDAFVSRWKLIDFVYITGFHAFLNALAVTERYKLTFLLDNFAKRGLG